MKARPSLPCFGLLFLPVLACQETVPPASAMPSFKPEKQPAIQVAKAEGAVYTPTRLRAWPKLEAWYNGSEVSAEPTASPHLNAKARMRLGAQLFSMYCVNCHGAEGKGDGPRALLFEPPPRDLTKGLFKFRSTPSGAPPTDSDLFRTISGGLRGTGMPSFADLSEGSRWALITYIRSLSGSVQKEDSIVIGPVPSAQALTDSARIKRGAKLFAAQGCANCHGASGRGDGPSAAALTNPSGTKAWVPDFATQPLKRGTPIGLYLSLSTGLDGTPMPAYGGSMKPEQLWDLVGFVLARAARPEKVRPEYRVAVNDFLSAQYAQSKHATIGGCGCQVRKIQNRLEAARSKMRTSPR